MQALKLNPYHEIASGKRGQYLRKLLKPLVRYCPFVENGIMRLGGRLQRSDEPYNMKQPIKLLRTNCLTGLIVNFWHQKSIQNAAAYAINDLREKFHVVGQGKTVK